MLADDDHELLRLWPEPEGFQELWRINDIGYHQNIFDKILGVSKIRMATQDKSHPEFNLVGLPPGRQIYDQMKEGVHIARQARNVLGMTE